MYMLKLAFRNIFRHKLRTIVSIIAIAFAVLVVVFARGYIQGMINSVYADHIQYKSGHIRIINKEYELQERLLALNYPVDGFQGTGIEEMVKKLEEIDGVKLVVPRIKFGAMATGDDKLITMMGWGVNPAKEIEFTEIENQIVEGRMVEAGKREIIMGTRLLQKLNKKVNEKITIVYNTSFNTLKGTTFKIVGRVDSGLKLLDESLFYLPLDQAQRILYMDGQATELLMALNHRDLTDEILPGVEEILANEGSLEKYNVISYKESGGMVPFLELAGVLYNGIYIFLIGLASFVVISTMIMIVRERTKEIGMMAALGMKRRGIQRLFIIEGFFIGVIGSFLGAITGSILNSFLAERGLDFSQAFEGMGSDIIMKSVIYPVSSPANTIFAFVLGVVVVTIACIIPARRAANLEPTEALREK